jgi:hypothetical protein
MHVQHSGEVITLPPAQSYVYGHSAGATDVVFSVVAMTGPVPLQVEGLHSKSGPWVEIMAPAAVAAGVVTPLPYAGCFQAIRIVNNSLAETVTGFISSRKND